MHRDNLTYSFTICIFSVSFSFLVALAEIPNTDVNEWWCLLCMGFVVLTLSAYCSSFFCTSIRMWCWIFPHLLKWLCDFSQFCCYGTSHLTVYLHWAILSCLKWISLGYGWPLNALLNWVCTTPPHTHTQYFAFMFVHQGDKCCLQCYPVLVWRQYSAGTNRRVRPWSGMNRPHTFFVCVKSRSNKNRLWQGNC